MHWLTLIWYEALGVIWEGFSCHWLPILSTWSSAVVSANAGSNPLHDWVWLLLSPWAVVEHEVMNSDSKQWSWSDQVFSCMGMSRSSDVCSKYAGVLVKLLVYYENLWDEQIPDSCWCQKYFPGSSSFNLRLPLFLSLSPCNKILLCFYIIYLHVSSLYAVALIYNSEAVPYF